MRVSSPASPPSGANASALVTALCGDPQALARLAQALVSAGLADAVHRSIDAAVVQHARQEAGRLLAGTVSTATGWLIPATGSTPAKAMVYLGGSTLAVACVVAPHVLPDLTAGAQVWVEPVNGSAADLWIVGIRAFAGTPVASQALTNAASAQTTANNALTAANRGGQFVAINPVVTVYGGSTASGTTLTSVLATSYSVPAGAKAILWVYYFTSATTGASVQFYTGQSMSSGIVANFGYTPVANDYLAGQAIIPLDTNGYFSWQIQSGDTITHFGRIVGYFI